MALLPVLELNSITIRHVGRAALEGVSLSVAAGAFVALVGPSGAGKTTLLKSINRLVEPDEGTILLEGRNIIADPPPQLRRRIGYAFQGIGLFPHMDVGENIAIVPRLLGAGETERAALVAELLDLVALPRDFAGRAPATLSGGQAQRVGLARALAGLHFASHDPAAPGTPPPAYAKASAGPPPPEGPLHRVSRGPPPRDPSTAFHAVPLPVPGRNGEERGGLMLLDEPFGALDPVTRDELGRAYRALHDRLGLTTLMVTHDMSEALLLADRVVVLIGGRIRADAAPAALIAGCGDEEVDRLVAVPKRQAERLEALRAGQGALRDGPSTGSVPPQDERKDG